MKVHWQGSFANLFLFLKMVLDPSLSLRPCTTKRKGKWKERIFSLFLYFSNKKGRERTFLYPLERTPSFTLLTEHLPLPSWESTFLYPLERTPSFTLLREHLPLPSWENTFLYPLERTPSVTLLREHLPCCAWRLLACLVVPSWQLLSPRENLPLPSCPFRTSSL